MCVYLYIQHTQIYYVNTDLFWMRLIAINFCTALIHSIMCIALKGLFTQKLSHNLLSLKPSYITSFFQAKTIRFIKNDPSSSKLYNGSEWCLRF